MLTVHDTPSACFTFAPQTCAAVYAHEATNHEGYRKARKEQSPRSDHCSSRCPAAHRAVLAGGRSPKLGFLDQQCHLRRGEEGERHNVTPTTLNPKAYILNSKS